jgi:hypothetical protein
MGRIYIRNGQVWEQRKGRYIGRRGRVIDHSRFWVTLIPEPGLCECPAKQRTTKIKQSTFLKEWEEQGE